MSNELIVSRISLQGFSFPATLSVLILDRSGSMGRFGSAPGDAVNEHIETLRNQHDGTNYFCSVVTFADTPQVDIPLALVRNIRGLESYCAEGNTLLWITVDETLRHLFKVFGHVPQGNDIRVVVGVFTDGKDNRSPQPPYPQKLQVIARRAQEAGWELYTYGFGVDAKEVAEEMGFPHDDIHAVTMEATAESVQDSIYDMTNTTTMGGGQMWRLRTSPRNSTSGNSDPSQR